MNELQEDREQIDNLNSQIANLLLERKKLSEKIGNKKRKLGIPVYDPWREAVIFEGIKGTYNDSEFNYLNPIFKIIVETSRNVQLESV